MLHEKLQFIAASAFSLSRHLGEAIGSFLAKACILPSFSSKFSDKQFLNFEDSPFNLLRPKKQSPTVHRNCPRTL